VGPRTSLDDMEKRKNFTLPGLEPQPMYKLKSFPFINGLVCVLKNQLGGGGGGNTFQPILQLH
jgi:hypothetical protein